MTQEKAHRKAGTGRRSRLDEVHPNLQKVSIEDLDLSPDQGFNEVDREVIEALISFRDALRARTPLGRSREAAGDQS